MLKVKIRKKVIILLFNKKLKNLNLNLILMKFLKKNFNNTKKISKMKQ